MKSPPWKEESICSLCQVWQHLYQPCVSIYQVNSYPFPLLTWQPASLSPQRTWGSLLSYRDKSKSPQRKREDPTKLSFFTANRQPKQIWAKSESGGKGERTFNKVWRYIYISKCDKQPNFLETFKFLGSPCMFQGNLRVLLYDKPDWPV